MSVRERILTIRLLEHIAKHPEFVAALGVEVIPDPKRPVHEAEAKHGS